MCGVAGLDAREEEEEEEEKEEEEEEKEEEEEEEQVVVVVFTCENRGDPLNTQHAQHRPVQATDR